MVINPALGDDPCGPESVSNSYEGKVLPEKGEGCASDRVSPPLPAGSTGTTAMLGMGESVFSQKLSQALQTLSWHARGIGQFVTGQGRWRRELIRRERVDDNTANVEFFLCPGLRWHQP